jgi:hypothetical protein
MATPKQENNELKHLFIILTKPVDGEVIVVNLSSCKDPFYDNSCILNKDNHSFIKHQSYISYRHSKIFKVVELEYKIVKQLEPVSNDVFNRITSGLLKSKEDPNKVKKFFIDYVNS